MDAYSYKRWSSARQGDGDSFLRQTELAREVCEAKGWNLIDLPPDAGVSSYRGKNLSHKGILGRFIKQVDEGKIQTPAVLVIERLDRFSRMEVDEVLPVFLDLLKKGVEVYSVLENDHYTIEKVKDNPTVNIIKMLMGFVGAHEYAKGIGQRVKAAKRRKREAALSGKKVWMFDCCPAYLDWNGSDYVTNEKTDTVRLIVGTFIRTGSLMGTAKILNEKGIKPFQSAKFWSATTVKDLVTSRQLLGEFKGVKDYFPRIIPDKDYSEVARIILKNSPGKGTMAHLYNFLRGHASCSKCGRPSVQISNKVGNRYIGCKQSLLGICDCKRLLKMSTVEETLFAMVLKSTPDDLLKDVDKDRLKKIQTLEAEKISTTKDIERLLSLQDIGLDVLRNRLEANKERLVNVDKELSKLRSTIHSTSSIKASVSELGKLLEGNDDKELDKALTTMVERLKDDSTRRKICEPLYAIVEKIVCDFEKMTYQVVYTTGVTSDHVYVGD